MKKQHLQEIIDCLPEDKTHFHYYRDRYSALLLPWLIEEGAQLSEVKKSSYAPLLNKQPAKQVVSQFGDGRFHAQAFSQAWAEPHECFLLTLGRWGGGYNAYDQTSRKGYNLVLQLNMNNQYLSLFNRCMHEDAKFWFECYSHPILKERENGFYRQTLGWARIDLDLETGEALIEEIQSDWIRDALSCKRYFDQKQVRQGHEKYKDLIQYCDTVVKQLSPIWDEAILTSALWFLREEIGIKTVWYHTYDTGVQLKKIKYCKPPKSVYSTLPKRFCFTRTNEHPDFLMKERSYQKCINKHDDVEWFVHRFI